MPSGSDAELIPFQLGEGASLVRDFESFYVAHRDTVARALSFAFNDFELGFEAADEAMARAYKQWGRVSTYANAEGWVFKVGLHWGRSWIRRRLTALVKAPMVLAGESKPETIEELASDTDLAAAVAGLGRDSRTVVVLRFQLDYSVAQIAQVLEIPEGTVKSRLSRAIRRLAVELGSVEPGEQP